MENKNGQGIFYGVIGVATLVVAIIGATFAYFSASTSANYLNNIAGNTLELTGGALSVSVSRLSFASASADSLDLVPATIATDSQTGDPTVAGINSALTANCEKNGYTGCHVYKIEASSASEVSVAQVYLETLTTTAPSNKSDWKYIIYTGTDSAASAIVTSGAMDLAAPYDMHSATQTLNSTPSVYYLMIYLAEDNHQTEAQNSGSTNDSTGSYSGTVTLKAAGGQVTANFTQS